MVSYIKCSFDLGFFFSCSFYLFIFGCAGSSLLCGLFFSCSKWGLLSSSGAWASHCGSFSYCGAQDLGVKATIVATHELRSCGSWAPEQVAVVHRLSCSVASGIFPDQRSNPCLLHWQMDSLPLSHQGSLGLGYF